MTEALYDPERDTTDQSDDARLSEPGIYDGVPEHHYHADCCAQPSLSASLAKSVANQSPLHAWAQHPRLNPEYEPTHSDKFDLGTAAHAMLLEGADNFVVVEADGWTTKAARAERDEARAAGHTPLLRSQYDRVCAMVEAAHQQLDQFERDENEAAPRPFIDGAPEQTVIWQESEHVWCRSRLDWLRSDRLYIDDYKTTATSANPIDYAKTLANQAFDVQAKFYARGIKHLTGVEPTFRFIVQETSPPYALCVVSLPPEWMELAAKKVNYAIRTWGACISRNEWPGYPTRTCYLDPPAWELAKWETVMDADE